MQNRFFRYMIFVLIPITLSVSSCSKKGVDSDEESISQASTRSTGSTNSNERINLTPYPFGRKQNTNDGPEEMTETADSKPAEVEKKDPPVYPLTDFLSTEKNYSSESPAAPSVPSTTTSVPPTAQAPSQVVLSNPPEIQTKQDPVPEKPAVVESPEPVVAEKAPEVKEEPPAPQVTNEVEETVDNVQQAEYERSLGNVSNTNITRKEFEEDKTAILAIIEKLDKIMKNKDYKAWLAYLEEESVKYWSTRNNLLKAQNRLPVKGLTLRTLEDYFKYVFIPSRSGRRVDEIRYETEKLVKAVQVNGENDTVYYYFKKSSNGTWKLHLPPISD